MVIFTSLTLGAEPTLSETPGDGEMQRMAVCDRLCLHEALCDACSVFDCVPLLCVQYTLYVAEYMTERVCVFQSWGAP